MRRARIFAAGLGDHNMVVEDVAIEVETSRRKWPQTREVLVLTVRPKASEAGRCSRCRRRCPGYDGGDGTRKWRTLDMGTTKTYLQAAAPRVSCAEHGVVVVHVPGARPGAKCTTCSRTHARGWPRMPLVNRGGEPAKIALGLLKLMTVPRWVPPQKLAGSPLPFSHEAG